MQSPPPDLPPRAPAPHLAAHFRVQLRLCDGPQLGVPSQHKLQLPRLGLEAQTLRRRRGVVLG